MITIHKASFSQFWEVLGPELLAVLQEVFSSSAWPLLANLHDSRGHHLAVEGQGLQGLVGQLPPDYPPQQRLQAASQGSGYPLWACPPACGGPHSDRFCAWWLDWRQCVVPFGGGGVPAANRSAWLHGFFGTSARHMTALAAPGC